MTSLDAARSVRFLGDKRIAVVLSVCSDWVPAQESVMHMKHCRIAVEDTVDANLLVELPTACAFIRAALCKGRNVLVHSARGQNRAPAVVAAYRRSLTCPIVTEFLIITAVCSHAVVRP
jgi:protein-tyrosine phosphatase